MKKILIIWALLISVCFAQSKAGFYVVGGKVITVQDTSSRKYLKAIENAGVVPSILQNFTSNYLVTSEKAIGSYSLMSAQWPMIGGTENTHAINQVTPGTFNLTYVNSPTHNNNGITTNGTNQYIETNFNLSTLTTRNNHVSIYLKSVGTSTSAHILGATNSSMTTSTLLLINRPNATTFLSASSANYQTIAPIQAILTGYYLGNSNATNPFLYKNGVDITATRVVGSSTVLPNLTMVIGGSKTSSVASFSQITTPLVTIGTSFTSDTQAQQQSRIATFTQSLQGRQ